MQRGNGLTRQMQPERDSEMRLADFARAVGISTASVKYYQREGILPGPRLINQTTGRYSRAHLERVQLIRVARERFDLPITRIRELCRIVDHAGVSTVRLMQACQNIALGRPLPPELQEIAGQGEDEAGRTPAKREIPRAEWDAAAGVVHAVVAELGWDPVPREALAPVIELVADSTASGVGLTEQYLRDLARALMTVAGTRVTSHAGGGKSRDAIAAEVLTGVDVQRRALLTMTAFVNAVQSIRATVPASSV